MILLKKIIHKISSLKTKLFLISGIALLLWFFVSLPKNLFHKPTLFVLEDAEGNLLSASIASDGQWRFPYNKNVPQRFIDCITTFEDKRFFSHPGVDVIAVTRSLIANIHRAKTQGASTISMQVARLA